MAARTASSRERVIAIRGAREHNLADVDLDLPRETLIVITGVSGSGKSSLAFDTIYAEGQRRYVESLSAYARQFLDQLGKPDVEAITGLPPTIAIEQRKAGGNPRSTVATTTDIYDYLRLLFARVGRPHCPRCDRPIVRTPPQQIVDQVLSLPEGTPVRLLAPVVSGKKGTHRDVFARISRDGFVRARVDGKELRVSPPPDLEKNKAHHIAVLVDRLEVSARRRQRIQDSVELSLRLGEGTIVLSRPGKKGPRDVAMSRNYACPVDGFSMPELEPRLFSFNSPYGACPTCSGLGTRLDFDPDLIVPDPDRSLQQGAIEAWRKGGPRLDAKYGRITRSFCRVFGADLFAPFRALSPALQRILLHGTTTEDERHFGQAFEGVIPDLARRFKRTQSDDLKRRVHQFMSESPCPECRGARLREEARSVRLGRLNIHRVTTLSVDDAIDWARRLRFKKAERAIATPILKEIRSRLGFLEEVGLGYLGLDRRAGTLSGGEAQRIRLATQVGSALVGVCYVLDEPTIGLHPRDTARLIRSMKRLRDTGNTVIVVEHDLDTVRAADVLVEMGPEAGRDGGRVVSTGRLAQVKQDRSSLTGAYLRSERGLATPKKRRPLDLDEAITVQGASAHNLKQVTARFPLGGLVAVTGVSGSGKSTLVVDILLRALKRRLLGARDKPGAHRAVTGIDRIDKVVEIDQSPIGRTPRSNPATYTKVFGEIREVFAKVREARVRGYGPSRFSFNVQGGRCEACQGQGVKRIEMHFLPDVDVPCPECSGSRYGRETLEIRYKKHSIADILDATVDQAAEIFAAHPRLKRALDTLQDVGLGYVRLGQRATTLSGGEAQRVKLAAELGRPASGRTLYILDEPTTGLHAADIERLLKVLNRLVDSGNSVVVIEHNLDVVKSADWVLDMGPEGGEGGGRIVAEGTPETIASIEASRTGRVLKPLLRKRRGAKRPAKTRKK